MRLKFLFLMVLLMFFSACGKEVKVENQEVQKEAQVNGQGIEKKDDKKQNNIVNNSVKEIKDIAKEEGEVVSIPDAPKEVVNKCELEYQKILAKYGQEYNDCRGESFTVDCEGVEKSQKQNNLIVIMDSSGSMAGKAGGETKIEIAKKSAARFLGGVLPETNLGLIIYGHKGNNTYARKQESCAGIEEVYSLGKIDSNQAKEAVDKLSATGWTPIANSLEKAKSILANFPSDKYNNTVLLISDGIETCDGDPIKAAKELNNSNLEIVIDVVGFDVSGSIEEQLRGIAENADGKYYSARTSTELDSTLENYNKTYCFGQKKYAWGVSKSQLDGAWSACTSRLGVERSDFATAYGEEVSRECYPYVSGAYNERRDSLQVMLNEIMEENKKVLEAINPEY